MFTFHFYSVTSFSHLKTTIDWHHLKSQSEYKELKLEFLKTAIMYIHSLFLKMQLYYIHYFITYYLTIYHRYIHIPPILFLMPALYSIVRMYQNLSKYSPFVKYLGHLHFVCFLIILQWNSKSASKPIH